MPNGLEWANRLNDTAFISILQRLYPGQAAPQARYRALIDTACAAFGDGEYELFSAPGRTELGGNHTDHQHGRVLAAAVTMDAVAAAKKSNDNLIRIHSEGYPELTVNLSSTAPNACETNSSQALVRGIAAFLIRQGFCVGGFSAAITSDVPKGSGLSSSAAYGVLIGSIWSGLYNNGCIAPLMLARAAQYAENVYFGKPSGLMDQLVCASGCIVSIDFKDVENPMTEVIDCDLSALGYTLCVVNAGGDHSGLTGEYASIPIEMKTVASIFGKDYLRGVDCREFRLKMKELRGVVSDRAILRAMHFFSENDRVLKQTEALKRKDISEFLTLMIQSGRSSFELLQNVCPLNEQERSLALALALSQRILEGSGGWRVHGGGFAGTILACMPNGQFDAYKENMEIVFGPHSCYRLHIRPYGGLQLKS